jgi:hypothetical protein
MARTRSGIAARVRLPEETARLLSFAALAAALLAALLLGAALRIVPADPPAREPTAAAEPATAPSSGGAAPPADPLAARLERDLARLREVPEGYTAQLAVLCDPHRLAEIVDGFGGLEPLHVLRVPHDGRACFAVCWSHYATPREARAAPELPPALRAIVASPLAKPIAELVR